MLDKITEKSPAKINLFLKIINKRKDGFHNIRTGATFINLYDEIIVKPNDRFEVIYSGNFAPVNNKFEDCIINKIFDFLNIKKPKLLFKINKNFPYKAGLGSASSNAATVIKILENLDLIKRYNIFNYVDLGSDIPFFLYQKDALIRGKGELISNIIFPKYYFLIVQPNFKCSTKEMYQSFSSNDFDYSPELDLEEINEFDNGNDFEKIIIKKEPQFKTLIDYLEKLDGVIFSRMTGSGSCIFSVFDKKEHAENAKHLMSNKFQDLWIETAENNVINLI
tara:strand:- start:243 stop:1079 length:837 start_codon:yes stop_codon:yes gene_type:complete